MIFTKVKFGPVYPNIVYQYCIRKCTFNGLIHKIKKM